MHWVGSIFITFLWFILNRVQHNELLKYEPKNKKAKVELVRINDVSRSTVTPCEIFGLYSIATGFMLLFINCNMCA